MKGKKITIKKGDKVLTTDGQGTVIDITGRYFPYFVKLDSGGSAWQDISHIISVIK